MQLGAQHQAQGPEFSPRTDEKSSLELQCPVGLPCRKGARTQRPGLAFSGLNTVLPNVPFLVSKY